MKLALLFALVVTVMGNQNTQSPQMGDITISTITLNHVPNELMNLINNSSAIVIVGNQKYDSEWENFKDMFKKEFDNDDHEKSSRQNWEQRFEFTNKHNSDFEKGIHKYKLGLHQYADMDHEDFVKFNGFLTPIINDLLQSSGSSEPKIEQPFNLTEKDVRTKNKTVDWRMEGIVSEVLEQGNCGSCWSVASAGALEAANALKTGKFVPLSPQNLIDCTVDKGNNGCNGGAMMYAYEYVIKNEGIDSAASYPYKAQVESNCKYSVENRAGTAKGFVNLPKGDEEALRLAVASIGPVSVAIDASLISFWLYQEGIYDDPDCNPNSLDHGVLVVGYGTENGSDYWLVKNSWGPTWGINGYVKLARNNGNQCGIANGGVYPLV